MNNRIVPSLFGLCMFMTGGCGLVVEYLIATSTSFILGSSVVVFSLVIGVMLGAMGVAGWVQEKIGDDNLILKFFGIESALFVLGSFSPLILFWAYGHAFEHFNLVLYTLTVSIGLLIGLEIPLVIRLLDQMGVGLSKNMKLVFGLDYLGAMVFMLFWVFYLLPNIPIYEVGFIVSGINYVVATITIVIYCYMTRDRGSITQYVSMGLCVVLLWVFYVYGLSNSQKWETYLEQKLYDDPVVHVETTQYQHIVITENKKTYCGKDIRLYINGNTQFSSCDESIYHDNLVAPIMNMVGEGASVLIIGGGDGLALRDVLKYNPSSVDLVDLDGEMVNIAKTNPYLSALNENAFDSAIVSVVGDVASPTNIFSSVSIYGTEVAEVRRYHLDASVFARKTRGTYDAIIIDLPDPSSVELSKLYTRGFYKALSDKLSDNGYMVVQSTSPLHAPEVYLEIGRTLNAAGLMTLGYHDNVPSFGDWGFYMACRSVSCVSDIMDRMSAETPLDVNTRYLTKDKFLSNMQFGLRDGKPFMESSKETTINTNMTPTLFMRYQKAWGD